MTTLRLPAELGRLATIREFVLHSGREQPRVERVLDLVDFTRFLEIYTDLETALASY